MKIHNLTLSDIEDLAHDADRSGVTEVSMTVSNDIFSKLPSGGKEEMGMVLYDFKSKIKFIKDDNQDSQ